MISRTQESVPFGVNGAHTPTGLTHQTTYVRAVSFARCAAAVTDRQ